MRPPLGPSAAEEITRTFCRSCTPSPGRLKNTKYLGFYQKLMQPWISCSSFHELLLTCSRDTDRMRGQEYNKSTASTAPGLVATYKGTPIPGYEHIKNHLLSMSRVEDGVPAVDDVKKKSRLRAYISLRGGQQARTSFIAMFSGMINDMSFSIHIQLG